MHRFLRAGAWFALAGTAIIAAATIDLNHPTGNKGLFLIDKLGTHVRFFDPVTYKEISSIELPKAPHDFIFSADHKLAYVPIYGDGVYGKNPHPGHEIAHVFFGECVVERQHGARMAHLLEALCRLRAHALRWAVVTDQLRKALLDVVVPPPQRVIWMVMSSGLILSVLATSSRPLSGNCVGAQISSLPSL